MLLAMLYKYAVVSHLKRKRRRGAEAEAWFISNGDKLKVHLIYLLDR